MTNITIVEATLDHVQQIGRTLNDEDRAEIENAGLVPHRDLWRGWKRSLIRYAAFVDNELAAVWGVTGSIMGGIGIVWFVTSRKAREISPHKFRSIYVSEVRKMLEIYPVLCNYVSADYDGAVRMLKVAGFNLEEPVPLGKIRRLYRKFIKEA